MIINWHHLDRNNNRPSAVALQRNAEGETLNAALERAAMKPVTGSVVSWRPMPLSKAATALKKFLASDNGADEEMLAYVRRASAAFDELVEFHSDIRHGRETRVVVDDVTETNRKKKKTEVVEMNQIDEREVEKKKKKKKKKNKSMSEEEVEFEVEKEVLANGVVKDESEKNSRKSHKKTRKTTMLDGGGYEEEETSDTQHKKRRESVEEDGLGVEVREVEVQKKKKKNKRKNAEDGVLEEGGLSEEHHHKKKKRKVREEV